MNQIPESTQYSFKLTDQNSNNNKKINKANIKTFEDPKKKRKKKNREILLRRETLAVRNRDQMTTETMKNLSSIIEKKMFFSKYQTLLKLKFCNR